MPEYQDESEADFDRRMQAERQIEQRIRGLYQQAGVRVDTVYVNIDDVRKELEIEVDIDDFEITAGQLARLSALQAITEESVIKSRGDHIAISTVSRIQA